MSNEKVSEITEYIKLAKWLVNDSNTFLKVRTERKFYIDSSLRLGGGNFMIALGLFSALSYLAKLYVLLSGKCTLPTTVDIENAKDLFKKNTDFRNYFYQKRSDSINETDAFIKLLSDPDCPQNFGLGKDEYSKIYTSVRNHLAHRIRPDYGYTMTSIQTDEGKEIPYEDIRSVIDRSSQPVFEKGPDCTLCFVDFLGRDVDRIADWLEKKLRNNEFPQNNIDITHGWLVKNT